MLALRTPAARVRGAEVEGDGEDERRRPGVYGVQHQWLVAANVVGDQPDEEPEERHLGNAAMQAESPDPGEPVVGLRTTT